MSSFTSKEAFEAAVAEFKAASEKAAAILIETFVLYAINSVWRGDGEAEVSEVKRAYEVEDLMTEVSNHHAEIFFIRKEVAKADGSLVPKEYNRMRGYVPSEGFFYIPKYTETWYTLKGVSLGMECILYGKKGEEPKDWEDEPPYLAHVNVYWEE